METQPTTPLVPNVVPAPGVPPPAGSKRRVWLRVLIAVVALGVAYAAAAYFTDLWPFPLGPVVAESPSPSPTTDPTAGWKTYTNAEFGFEVKYPGSLTAFTGSEGATDFQKRTAFITIDSPTRIAEIQRVLSSQGGGIPTAFLTVTAYEPRQVPGAPECGEPDDPREVAPSSITTIGGITVQKCGGIYMTGETYYHFRFSPDQTVYYEVIVILHGEIGEGDVAEEIISTFRFTK